MSSNTLSIFNFTIYLKKGPFTFLPTRIIMRSYISFDWYNPKIFYSIAVSSTLKDVDSLKKLGCFL